MAEYLPNLEEILESQVSCNLILAFKWYIFYIVYFHASLKFSPSYYVSD